ncbi:hypothetical protein ACWEPR_29180 [Streptomyces sp. NPDC004290]|uniref:hypothetical protein n=1 Tax=unclassified Streptomyces TaxID=2593676 RepID=UPI0036894275
MRAGVWRSPAREPDEGGYGLLLVAALATAWGVRDRPVGKTVWATVPLGGPLIRQNTSVG